MSERRTRSGGAAQRSGPRTPLTKPSRSSKRKSGSDLPNTFPEIWPKTTPAAPVRKAIVLKKIVAHAVEVPDVHTLNRSPRISFILEKENNPPLKVPTKEDLFKTCSVPGTPSSTPVLYTQNVESNSGEAELDTRDLEMSQKVRRSYGRLQGLGCASTSTPGRRSFFGFEGPDDLPGVSPVVCSKLMETPKVPAKQLVPDRTLPGISPPVVKEKRKKRIPEIPKSELDKWAMAMNAEFEAAEQFDLLIE
ncbi:sororin [Apodemus sylvaticus]|uniref:sororin n=1 Tax=Apodemus sylvaticus TaxID=10129 RepID=UPI0022424EDD|nr:sororin [Apodemus sylvaticus]